MTAKTPLRLVFMGTPDFSVATAQALLDGGHQIVCVYCQPPRPAGRGKKIQKAPVHRWAESNGIPVRTPQSLKNPMECQAFADLQVDAGVVVAYGLILPQPILDAPKMGCFNVHASLLPRWRGAAPIQRAIQAGDTQTGVVIMHMDAGLDTGDMVLQDTIAITEKTTCGDLHHSLAKMGGDLIIPALDGMADGSIIPTPQTDQGVTYAHKITKTESFLNWHHPAQTLDRLIRGFTPFPGTFFYHKGVRIKVHSAESIAYDGNAPPGTVLDDIFTIACGQNALRITTAQRPGKTPMDGKTFLLGYPLQPGDRVGE